MNKTEGSPLAVNLLLIHKIISRGLTISIRNCDNYLQGMPGGEADGFATYVSTLKTVTHAHHLSEDEIAFPFFKDLIEAPFDQLTKDHQEIARLLLILDEILKDFSSGGLNRLRGVLGEFEKLWISHIRIEEENFTPEKVRTLIGIEEQRELMEKLSMHGRQHSAPGALTLPFMIYNLEGTDREIFTKHFPWIIKKILVPVIWKSQWKPMERYFKNF